MKGDKKSMESIEEIRKVIESRKGSKPNKEEEVVPEDVIVVEEEKSKLTQKQRENLGIGPLDERDLDRRVKRTKEKKSGS